MHTRSLRFYFYFCGVLNHRQSLKFAGQNLDFCGKIAQNSKIPWKIELFFFVKRFFFQNCLANVYFMNTYRVYDLEKNRGALVLMKYTRFFSIISSPIWSQSVPITTYINPQILRFFEICGVSTVRCPNHYITITLIFAT